MALFHDPTGREEDSPCASGRANQQKSEGGDGGHDEEQHHHAHGAVLVLVVDRGTDEAVRLDGLAKGTDLREFRSRATGMRSAFFVSSAMFWSPAATS